MEFCSGPQKNEHKNWENLKLRNLKAGFYCIVISVKCLDTGWGSISDVDRDCYLLFDLPVFHYI
jgi:hypothetical protein